MIGQQNSLGTSTQQRIAKVSTLFGQDQKTALASFEKMDDSLIQDITSGIQGAY